MGVGLIGASLMGASLTGETMKAVLIASRYRSGPPIYRSLSRTSGLLACPASMCLVSRPANLRQTVYTLVLLLCLNAPFTRAQAPDTGWQGRPRLLADIELLPRTKLQAWGELQDGINFSFHRWRTGFLLNRRLKPISKQHRRNIDAEKEHHLVFGAGYEYLHTIENGRLRIENRILTQLTPNYLAPGGILITDRNRVEFRWVNGAYDVRYRNRLVVQRDFELHNFQFEPYASGELFYDRDHQSWNHARYGAGVQFPYKNVLLLDTYLLRQNCTTCSQRSINMLGVTITFYFRHSK